MIASGKQRLLSFALPSVSISPVSSNVARKPLSGSVVTNKRGGLSSAFLPLGELGVMMVASLSPTINRGATAGFVGVAPRFIVGGAGRRGDVSGGDASR